MNHRLRFIHNKTDDFQLTNDRINRRHTFAPRMVGFTPPYRNKAAHVGWMPGAARLPDNLDLTEH